MEMRQKTKHKILVTELAEQTSFGIGEECGTRIPGHHEGVATAHIRVHHPSRFVPSK